MLYRRTTFGQTVLSLKGNEIWNNLPAVVRDCPTYPTFKTHLKDEMKLTLVYAFCCCKADIWKFVVIAAECGVSVCVILLVSAILWSKRKAGENFVDLFV